MLKIIQHAHIENSYIVLLSGIDLRHWMNWLWWRSPLISTLGMWKHKVDGCPQPYSNLGIRLGYTSPCLKTKQDKTKRKHLLKEVRISGTPDLEGTVNWMMPRMVKLCTSMDALAHQPSPRQASLQLMELSVKGQIHDQYFTSWWAGYLRGVVKQSESKGAGPPALLWSAFSHGP